MPTICQEPALTANHGPARECRKQPDRSCINCRIPICWQHAARRCPKGRNTVFGRQQHMTDQHQRDTEGSTNHRVADIKLRRGEGNPKGSHLVAVTVAYTTANRFPGVITLYPGSTIADGRGTWRPAPSLAKYLANREGTTPAEEENRTWPTQNAVKKMLLEAGKTKRPIQAAN